MYHNCPELDTTDPIVLRPARGWASLPASGRPPLEATLPVLPATAGPSTALRAGPGPTYHALAWSQGAGYDTLTIALARDAARPVTTLSAGAWSDWVRAPFYAADQGQVEGAFRFKLLELSPDGQRLRLYRSDAFPTDGRFCSDPALGQRLVAELGPYLHAGMSCALHAHGQLDWETVAEVMAAEAAWWSRAAGLAMDEAGAALLVLHWHILDEMGHRFVPLIDPTGTAYDPQQADAHWEIVRSYYRAADRFLGAFLERLDDGQTVFAVVSDHGMPANKKAVSLINLFREQGWVALTADGQDVDWAQSQVFFAQNHLWINLQGRDEGGIVPAQEYRALRAQVLAAMRDLKDPETGEHVLAFVLPREDAPMVGLWGETIGDLVYCYSGGYRWSGPEVLRLREERIVFPCGGGNHGPMIPTYETETTSVMGTLLLAGPGVRPGVQLPREEQARVCATDLAPTLAYLLGLDAPAQNEGRVLREFLRDLYVARPPRTVRSVARPLVHRPAVRPHPAVLQGDVTDEG